MKNLGINKLGWFCLIFLMVGALVFSNSYRFASSLDAGNHTSHSSSSSSSSSSSGSYHSGGSYGGKSLDFKKMPLWEKILILSLFHSFTTIFHFIFAKAIANDMTKNKILQWVIIISLMLIKFVIIFRLDRKNPDMGMVLDFISVFVVAFLVSKRDTTGDSKTLQSMDAKELGLDVLQIYGISDINKLKNELYDVFIEIEKAWMDFDYVALQNLCTDELYNQYKAQLDVYKLKNEKNIMDGFKRLNCVPYQISSDGSVVTLKVLLEITMHDYIINEKSGVVTSGNKNTVYDMTYELTYVRSAVALSNKCPNCGAPISDNKGTECEYCGSQLVMLDDSWKISDKVCIRQKNK